MAPWAIAFARRAQTWRGTGIPRGEKVLCVSISLHRSAFSRRTMKARLTDRSWPRRGGPPLLCCRGHVGRRSHDDARWLLRQVRGAPRAGRQGRRSRRAAARAPARDLPAPQDGVTRRGQGGAAGAGEVADHGGRAGTGPAGAPARLLVLRLPVRPRRAPDALHDGRHLSLHVRPGAFVLYVRATRTSLLRAVRTRGAGQLAPSPHALHVRRTRTSLGRAVHAAHRGTPGRHVHGLAEQQVVAAEDRAGEAGDVRGAGRAQRDARRRDGLALPRD
eukprot:scaffold131386_cov69-Phaeocystis_antarctica.AAC.2